MSTTEYLRTLTLEQLEFARDKANQLIKEFMDQERVSLLIVYDCASPAACFTEDQLDAAKVKVCELIMSNDFKLEHLRDDHPMIKRLRVRESEVAEWMKINT